MTARPAGIDLRRFYLVAIVSLAALLGGLFWVVLHGSRLAVAATEEQVRSATTRRVAEHLQRTLDEAERALTGVELEVSSGLIDGTPASFESALYGELERHDDLAELTFTYGVTTGDQDGEAVLAPEGRGQISVFRARAGHVITRVVRQDRGAWIVEERVRPLGSGFAGAPLLPTGAQAADPTEHDTFRAPASQQWRGRAVWSDRSWSDLDADLPEADRRQVITVQKALLDRGGQLRGVLRAGLVSDELDRVNQLRVGDDEHDPHRVFVCDRAGRLITRLSPDDRVAEIDGELRVVPAHPEPAIAAALALPGLDAATAAHPLVAHLDVGGAAYLATLTPLPDDRTQGWLVGIVVPEAYYTAGLIATRNQLVAASALLAILVLLGGALSLRAIRSGLNQVVTETTRMQGFDFRAAPTGAGAAPSAFADVNAALGSLEVAKTALRAMGRYVPVELVRTLYRDGREPRLGGELQALSLLFSDIEGFTTFSEELVPAELADALGAYLAVMCAAVHAGGGTVDKFIGDSVMAMWNAPLPVADHARRACQAALACQEGLERLYDSPAWTKTGRPRWRTRFGLHGAEVLVGHFGAPDRMSFTALGDGVNAASRIEGLNKLYGTTIIASAAIRDAAGEGFTFRRLDRVAVKGKTEAIELYELGAAGNPGYEAALDAYFAGRFAEALAGFAAQPDDAPSRLLAARCRELLATPPAAWDGVYHARTK